MAKVKFILEDFITEVAIGKSYCVQATPFNCTIKKTNEKAYIISDRAGNLLVLTESEIENGAFVLRNAQPIKF